MKIDSYEIENLEIKFDKKIILEKENFKFISGKIYTITGNSGSGKTSLINAIGLLSEQVNNAICKINGHTIDKRKENEKAKIRRKLFTYISQQDTLLNHLNVRDNIQVNYISKNKKKLSDQKIYEILKEFNIATYINREVNDMSGGERQRIELIRTIIVGSPIIICDEPTTGLDEENTDFFIKTVKLIAKSLQKIVIIVTHDKKISEIGDVKYVIKNNKIEKRVV